MKTIIGDPKDYFPDEKWYPIVRAITPENLCVIVVVPYDFFKKMSKIVKKKDEFIEQRFLADQGSIFRIFISFVFEELNEEFMIDISEDTTIIPTLIEQKIIFFTSDHKFKLGKEYQEELISLHLDSTINDLVKFNDMKKAIESIKLDARLAERRIIWCTHCKAKTLFSSLKKTCPFCEKVNFNYNDKGDFIF